MFAEGSLEGYGDRWFKLRAQLVWPPTDGYIAASAQALYGVPLVKNWVHCTLFIDIEGGLFTKQKVTGTRRTCDGGNLAIYGGARAMVFTGNYKDETITPTPILAPTVVLSAPFMVGTSGAILFVDVEGAVDLLGRGFGGFFRFGVARGLYGALELGGFFSTGFTYGATVGWSW